MCRGRPTRCRREARPENVAEGVDRAGAGEENVLVPPPPAPRRHGPRGIPSGAAVFTPAQSRQRVSIGEVQTVSWQA